MNMVFNTKATALKDKFARVETRLQGPWFDGERFSLVDAVGRCSAISMLSTASGNFGILGGLSNVAAWRALLAERPSVQGAVAPNYPAVLLVVLPRARLASLAVDGGQCATGRMTRTRSCASKRVRADGWKGCSTPRADTKSVQPHEQTQSQSVDTSGRALAETDFAARITSPGTGAPASMRNSAWMIFDCRPEDVSNRST